MDICQVVTEQGWWESGHMSSSYRAGMVGEWTYVKQLQSRDGGRVDICQAVTEQGWWESGHMSSTNTTGIV